MKVAVTQERRAPAEPPIPLDRPMKRELEKGDSWYTNSATTQLTPPQAVTI
jgi:hypothetical protein